MDKTRLAQLFRHLIRDVLNETDEEVGQPFDAIAAFMAEQCLSIQDKLLKMAEADADMALQEVAPQLDHQFDAFVREARDEVKRFAGLNSSHPDHRHLLGAIQGAVALGTKALVQ